MMNLPISKSLFPKFTQEIKSLMQWAHAQLWVYDIETYPNFFSCAVINVKTLQCYYFELSPWYDNMAELNRFLYYLNDNSAEMVGYNNQAFDWPVVNYAFIMMPAGLTNADIFKKVQLIFGTNWEDRNNHVIWADKQFVRQIDLFKINHYDNTARSTSLKMLENNMGMENIEELPVTPGYPILLNQRDTMYCYNWHDVAATLLFLSYNTKQIDLRRKLTNDFSHDFINSSDAKIGSDIFKLQLKKAGLPVDKKTPRDSIAFKECLFNYIQFERPEFKAVQAWLVNTVITQTKEALNDINVPYSLAQYMNPNDVVVYNYDGLLNCKLRKGQRISLNMIPAAEIITGCMFIAKNLHVIVDGFQFDFGTGGIHGSISSSVVKTNATHKCVDIDFASYYPNIGIKSKSYPAHLGVAFCDTNEDIYNIRKNYSKKTHPMENKAYKLAINAAFGNSNSAYSFLYDPKYTMTITLNGQLILCMLSEQLLKVPGLTLIQINTDGVTYFCPAEQVAHTMALCRWCESFTGLELEDITYEAMYIRDVNNYIAVDDKGERKYKGAYDYKLKDEWHKNFSQRIVGMAAEAALIDNISVIDYLTDKFGVEENKHLFCMRSKVDKSSKCLLVKDGQDLEVQRVTRYFAARVGGDLVKLMKPTKPQILAWEAGNHYMHETTGDYQVKRIGVEPSSGKYQLVAESERRSIPDRRISIEAGCKVQPCNDMKDFDWGNIDLNYYIAQANKLVDPLIQ
jgi:hypothetical protein